MTDREKAIVMAHTGICMLVGEKMGVFYQYLNELYGRPVYTHELVTLDIKEKSIPDFLQLCKEEEPSAERMGRWIPVTEQLPEEEGQYLVSCDTDYGIEVGRFYIDEDGERYFGCDWNDPDDIEAWMPLPEPYKRDEWNG